VWIAVLVAALGYFVDIYDLVLFSVLRKSSLADLGFSGADVLDKGTLLLNWQMGGMLLGGILWGVLGDKRGRLSVLFGSILLYSAANIANARVETFEWYAVWRFIAGIGLAGELGAGVTLVAEVMPARTRGYGTMIVASVGLCGAVAACLLAKVLDWRTLFLTGGIGGLLLLVLRISTFESGMFERVRSAEVRRGDFSLLFRSRQSLLRYVNVILIGVPIWYVVGILMTFIPEIGAAMGLDPQPSALDAVLYCYIGLSFGDMTSGWLSQWVRARRKVVLWFLLLTMAGIAGYFTFGRQSHAALYTMCGILGFAAGYWAVFVTMAAEQFGTNIRATVATTAPNFVRGAVVLLTSSFAWLKPSLGVEKAALVVGAASLAIALLALTGLEETYGKDLDFTE
jgi:MFS family permease